MYNYYWVTATLSNIVKAQFLVRVKDSELAQLCKNPLNPVEVAIEKVRRINQSEVDAGDIPLYNSNCQLWAEPVEFDGEDVISLDR